MNEDKQLREYMIDSTVVYEGRMLHVECDKVKLPNGHESTRELLRHVGAVAIVPINEKGEVAMERQFRYPLDRVITEIPAGKLDSYEEDRLDAAKRELMEETGITAGKWTSMGNFVPAAAYCSELITIYLAEDLTLGERKLDEDEFLNVIWIPLDELVEDVMNGNITDGKTLVGILKAKRIMDAR